MFGYAMRTRPLKNLGMKLAAETRIGAFPLLDYLIVTCESVAQGVNQLARYFRLNDAPYTLEIRANEDPSVSSSTALAILSLLNSGFLRGSPFA